MIGTIHSFGTELPGTVPIDLCMCMLGAFIQVRRHDDGSSGYTLAEPRVDQCIF